MPDGGFVSPYTDVTDLKRAEEALATKAGELEAALAEARALISRGVSDPYLLAAAYASGIVLARPLRPAPAPLAPAAASDEPLLHDLPLVASEAHDDAA